MKGSFAVSGQGNVEFKLVVRIAFNPQPHALHPGCHTRLIFYLCALSFVAKPQSVQESLGNFYSV